MSEIKPDVIFWTGDNSPHNIWENSEDEVIRSTKIVTDMLKAALKNTNIQVLPIHGNHDTWPSD